MRKPFVVERRFPTLDEEVYVVRSIDGDVIEISLHPVDDEWGVEVKINGIVRYWETYSSNEELAEILDILKKMFPVIEDVINQIG
jgi:hypothetical protein